MEKPAQPAPVPLSVPKPPNSSKPKKHDPLSKPKNSSKKKPKNNFRSKNIINNFYNFSRNPEKITAEKSTGMPKTGANQTSSGFQCFHQPNALPDVSFYFSKMQVNLDMIFKDFDGVLTETCLMDDNTNEISIARLKKSLADHFTSADSFLQNLQIISSIEFFVWSNYLYLKDKSLYTEVTFETIPDSFVNTA